ncbi:MAG: ead/Ea22-like family protein [Microbacterium gubbeenense]|uniref:ead/Ea22-like family protein n=1 Tax=Microbacterium gubbeenense TaxID=159896 RepID=UPI003F99FA7C
MTTIDTKRLRELAEAATSGPWHHHRIPNDDQIHDIRGPINDLHNVVIYAECEPEDARYIAAIDPPTLIALLDELEKYRSWADRILGNPPDLNEQHERLKAQIAATGVLEQRVIQPGEARSL